MTTYAISGMHCASCAMKIEKALSMNKEKSAEIQIVREKDFVGALMGK